jgi:hypothetical protein
MPEKTPTIQFALRTKEERQAIINYARAQGLTVNSYLESVAIKLIEESKFKKAKR